MNQGRTFNESASYRQNDPAIPPINQPEISDFMNDEQARLRMDRPKQPVPPPFGLSFIEKVTDSKKTTQSQQSPYINSQQDPNFEPSELQRITWERDELQAKLEAQETAWKKRHADLGDQFIALTKTMNARFDEQEARFIEQEARFTEQEAKLTQQEARLTQLEEENRQMKAEQAMVAQRIKAMLDEAGDKDVSRDALTKFYEEIQEQAKARQA
ncbi:hypothetical protein FGO68_gene9907 [Halteria grandinella]|uniref:Uncharacterized protein n=1 Tax=Halteria grandinella TaxID=5974 RepID=A0A8J8NWS8_HALGN|nr:hypothetical protein FGO68_gene9907 [Halteria grandinella]